MGDCLRHVVQDVCTEGTLGQTVGRNLCHHLLPIMAKVVVFQGFWIWLLKEADLADKTVKGATPQGPRIANASWCFLLLERNTDSVIIEVINGEQAPVCRIHIEVVCSILEHLVMDGSNMADDKGNC